MGGVAEQQMPLQMVNSTVEEALQWSYPLPPAMVQGQKQDSKLSVLAKALSDVGALEEDVIDVTAVANSIAMHVLQLLQDPRYESLQHYPQKCHCFAACVELSTCRADLVFPE